MHTHGIKLSANIIQKKDTDCLNMLPVFRHTRGQPVFFTGVI